MQDTNALPHCFTPFSRMVTQIALPEEFTFPFYYEPHELSRIAAAELQERLKRKEFDHNFGLEGDPKGLVIGKMFGVLVVRTAAGEIGYLSAFSGKMANSNLHEGFVPPVFDILQEGDFFLEGSEELNSFTEQIELIENGENLKTLRSNLETTKIEAKKEIDAFREEMRIKKAARKIRRAQLDSITNMTERAIEENDLIRESLMTKHTLKLLNAEWDAKLQQVQVVLDTELKILKKLKELRKAYSGNLQKMIFSAYSFLNAKKERKNLFEIFEDRVQSVPPSGAGECAAPKLLQYAYLHDLQPIALAEFWWGSSPNSEIRKHEQFYPSCRGKCEPILGHMLQGLKVAENPILKHPSSIPPLDILFEDDSLLIINKPPEFLSVPGRSDLPSIYDQVKANYPDATGSLVVHRLDMATSGVLLFAKTQEANKFVQAQFIKKSIHKRYLAVLDGVLEGDKGTVDLPIRLDVDDRPRQLVDHKHGKKATTHWEVIDRLYGKTRVYFYPQTGRTHQLRVHAAHVDGLNTPIIGDDLYGTKADRLHLHAETLTFMHPETREIITVTAPAPF